MKILGVIPARGGSKGIPNKNIVDLAGLPLIAYTIREAAQVAGLHRVVVSTESDRIAQVARAHRGDVPFLRSAALGGDGVRSADVVLDMLDRLEADQGVVCDAVCLLQPTSPLRTAADVDAAIDLLIEKGQGTVVSVTRVEEPHPMKMKVIRDGRLQPFLPGTDSSVPRQALPEVYQLNGAVYLTPVAALRETGSFFGNPTWPLVMPPERSVNINGPLDLLLAEALLRHVERA